MRVDRLIPNLTFVLRNNCYTITSYIWIVQKLTLNCPNNIFVQSINQHSFFLKSKVIFALDYIQIVFKCKKRSGENYMCSNKWVSAARKHISLNWWIHKIYLYYSIPFEIEFVAFWSWILRPALKDHWHKT